MRYILIILLAALGLSCSTPPAHAGDDPETAHLLLSLKTCWCRIEHPTDPGWYCTYREVRHTCRERTGCREARKVPPHNPNADERDREQRCWARRDFEDRLDAEHERLRPKPRK